MTVSSASPGSQTTQLGHERLDAAHGELIELAGEIERLIRQDEAVRTIADHLAAFHLLLTCHCAEEEDLLGALPADRHGGAVTEHRRAHRTLTDTMRALAQRAADGAFDRRDRKVFGKAVIQLLGHQLVDDAALVGALIREGLHGLSPHPEETRTES